MIATTSAHGMPARPRKPGVHRALGAVLAALAVWMLVGVLVAPEAGEAYFARMDGSDLITNATTSTVPAIPPFWIVQMKGTVTEPSGLRYTSVQVVLIEPLTGVGIALGTVDGRAQPGRGGAGP